MPSVTFDDFYEVPDLNFDITRLREDLDKILKAKKFDSPGVTHFGAISLNQIPNDKSSIEGNNIDKIEISTHHFKGNFPSHCSLQATYLTSKNSKKIVNSSNKWKYLLKNTNLSANKTHTFKNTLMKKAKINHIKKLE